jgi:hypothetical protein
MHRALRFVALLLGLALLGACSGSGSGSSTAAVAGTYHSILKFFVLDGLLR